LTMWLVSQAATHISWCISHIILQENLAPKTVLHVILLRTLAFIKFGVDVSRVICTSMWCISSLLECNDKAGLATYLWIIHQQI
jgi:hypothetical protein